MAVYVDQLFDTAAFTKPGTPRCFRNRQSCHLWSDLPGAAGTAELLEVAKAVGLKPAWLQNPGTYREHFDLVPAKRVRVLGTGRVTEVSWTELAVHFGSKKRAMSTEAT